MSHPILNTEMEIRTHTLERIRVAASTRISGHMLEALDLETYRDDMLDALVVQLRTEVLAEKTADKRISVYIDTLAHQDFPRSPFQHWKEKHSGAWWLRWYVRRWRVKTEVRSRRIQFHRTVDVEQFALFPDAPALLTPPGMRGPIVTRFERTSVSHS